ncbi:hypothetical protein BBO99_00003186 [Phytophthora kernoviae]|uniref:Bromo domain-containing protein n=1 Tax=Phytophthora kernoviae TaxID=325452 RepID=A0A421GV47_9STRA|nr:hypothetical protein BBO99_00003186 [Phytophthora kernoviae]
MNVASAWFLVKNYPFIRTQICDLFPDKDTYLESMFFKQLHRLHENYTLREARHQKEMAEREVRRAKRENELLRRRQRAENERQRLKDEREEERKQKEQEQKYPVEDLALLEGEAVGTNSLPLLYSNLKGIEGPLLGEIIMAWQTISTFKDFVGLESISLEALVECITAQCDEGTNIGLARIFIAFLRVILAEKSFMSLMDDLAVEGNTKVSDLFINNERTYGMCERASGDMLNAVTWQEILRQFMSKDLGIDPSIGHVEPLIVRNPMDLGTIKMTLESGGYEGPGGYDKFAADIRLVWENAVLYNGEESEVGRAALALSDDMQAEKIADDNAVEQERKTQAEEMQRELNSIVIRESPLGRDRYHNSYYMFKHDSKPRLFIERSDSGDFTLCSNKAQLMEILEWLNPKGIRELDLLTRLQEVKDKLLCAFDEDEGKQHGEATTEIVWNTKGGMELQMFPLPGGAIKGDTMIITDADKVIKSYDVARKMLLCLKKHLEDTNTLPASWEGAQTWCSRVGKASSFQEQLDLFAELESAAVTALSSGVETIRPSWQRKRHEWRLALEGSCTYAQLVFLLHVLLEEFINVEAFMDLHIRLDRREWLKLRPKETRNFIPEAGKVVLYFGDGHALALKEDEKSKRKRFTQKSDSPVRNATMVCTVEKVSYHHGGGDPYALAVLNPVSDMAHHDCLFCEGRFPTLPPLAHNLVSVADSLIKKWGKEIRACEDISGGVPSEKEQLGTKDEEKVEGKSSTTELPSRPIVTILRLENRLPEYIVDISRYAWAVNRTWCCGERFRMLFRNPQGQPGEYYGGVTAGSLPFDEHGMLPWEALRVTWDEDDGSDDNRINPWEAELPRGGNRA